MGILKGDGSSISGPPDMSSIDWSLPHHQRCVAACLVKATYLVEKDRQGKRDGPDALARPWYESLHFKLNEKLVDDSECSIFADYSIFGAIYESIEPPVQDNSRGNAPKFVIAFRGTLLKKQTRFRDIQLDLRIVMNLHTSSRCKKAVKSAREIVATAGAENVWIAGHSLGATIGTHVGKTLAVEGSNATTFLFNRPLLAWQVRWSLLDQLVNVALLRIKGHKTSEDFARLSSWVPNIYVNPQDKISSGNISYFKHRGIMGNFWCCKSPAKGSFLVRSSPLLPSANLTENHTQVGVRKAHSINQWFDPHQDMPSKEYLYGGGGNKWRFSCLCI